ADWPNIPLTLARSIKSRVFSGRAPRLPVRTPAPAPGPSICTETNRPALQPPAVLPDLSLPLRCRLLIRVLNFFFLAEDLLEKLLERCARRHDSHHNKLPELRQQPGLQRHRRSATHDQRRQPVLCHLVALG